MRLIAGTHEYAGFRYEIKHDGSRYWAFPHPDQHPASLKDKHRRAAIETYLQNEQ